MSEQTHESKLAQASHDAAICRIEKAELIDGANDCMTDLREDIETKDVLIKELVDALFESNEIMGEIVHYNISKIDDSYFTVNNKALAHAKEVTDESTGYEEVKG